jgi:hypothetical protein
MVSRLTYYDSSIFTGEAFTRFDFNGGWFMKANVGGGALWDGKLKDEDFEPYIIPYSATLSELKGSSTFYGTVDAGFKLIRGPDFHLGAFAGYHFMRDSITANGCGQIATNPFVCGAFPIPDQFRVISQINNWHSVRVGLEAAVEFDRWKFSVEGAYLPYVRLNGKDFHWLRIGTLPGDFTGGIPEDGEGWGYQFEGMLSYRVNEIASFGVGARYWNMQTKGHTHFEGHVVGFAAQPQPVRWKTESFGVFVQGSVKLGPYPVIAGN